jgi:large subunit ribosomal protein L29
MKQSEIRQLTDIELQEQLEDEKNIYTKLKLNHAVSPLDNPQKLKETRKNIARLATEMEARKVKENKS